MARAPATASDAPAAAHAVRGDAGWISPALLGWLVTGLVLVGDLVTPLGINEPLLYVLPVLLGLRVHEVRYAYSIAAVATLLTGVGYHLSPPGTTFDGLINRLMNLPVLWATAVIVARHATVNRRLREQSQQMQVVFDTAGMIFVLLDLEGRIRLINSAALNLLKIEEHEALGANWFDRFVPAAHRARVRAVHHDLILGRVPPNDYENPVVTAQGEERLVAWHNDLLRDAHGRISGTLSAGRDITVRKRAEEALSQSRKDLEDIKAALDQAAIVAATDQRGVIKYVNDKFCEISGYTREELIGQDHRIINSSYHPKEFIRTLWRTIASGKVWRGQIRNRAKGGSFYWVDTTIVPFLDQDGKPYQYLAIRSDITEAKRSEERLREQAALTRIGEMAAVVAHEVRNPIAGATGALQVISDRLPADAEDRKVIASIIERFEALDGLIDDLMVYAKPRAPRLATIDLAAVIDSAVMLLPTGDPAVRVTVEREAGRYSLNADAEQLRGALLNLLLNARQASPPRGAIVVRLEGDGTQARITVSDEGPGIPPEHRERIFEPFFTTKHRGTGLGLAIAKRVVEWHEGTIDVVCPPEGGTRVTMTLPHIGASSKDDVEKTTTA